MRDRGASVDEVIDDLIARRILKRRWLQGCSAAEIEAVRVDQAVSRIPAPYVRLLGRLGRRAGPLLVGSDAFYPEILGLKEHSRQLLVEAAVGLSLGPDALVIAVHQGYQFFWIPSVLDDNPQVLQFQEGDDGPCQSWPGVAEYLRAMSEEF